MTNIIREIAFGISRGFGIYFFERQEILVPVAAPDLQHPHAH
jgi:hypothetical protein